MRKRVAKPAEQIFVMKITQSNCYGMVRGFPYRVLAIPGEYTLYHLARSINDSFGFDFDHPFGFYSKIADYYHSEEGYELFSDLPDTKNEYGESSFGSVKKASVKSVFTEPKKKMLYLFDYGDEWHYLVQLLKVEQATPGKPYPEMIQNVGKARPQYEKSDELDELCRVDDDEEDRKARLEQDIKMKLQKTLSEFGIPSTRRSRKR